MREGQNIVCPRSVDKLQRWNGILRRSRMRCVTKVYQLYGYGVVDGGFAGSMDCAAQGLGGDDE